MDFSEKLNRLVGARQRADMDRKIGMPVNSTSNLINRGHIPRLDTAHRIAVALGVDLDWLADDTAGWPPPEAAEGMATRLLSQEERDRCEELAGKFPTRAAFVAAALRQFLNADDDTKAREVYRALDPNNPIRVAVRDERGEVHFVSPIPRQPRNGGPAARDAAAEKPRGRPRRRT